MWVEFPSTRLESKRANMVGDEEETPLSYSLSLVIIPEEVLLLLRVNPPTIQRITLRQVTLVSTYVTLIRIKVCNSLCGDISRELGLGIRFPLTAFVCVTSPPTWRRESPN